MVGVSLSRSGEQPAISVLVHSVQMLELKMRRPASLQDSCALVPCIEGGNSGTRRTSGDLRSCSDQLNGLMKGKLDIGFSVTIFQLVSGAMKEFGAVDRLVMSPFH